MQSPEAANAKYGTSLWAQSDADFAKYFGALTNTTGRAGFRKSPPLRGDSVPERRESDGGTQKTRPTEAPTGEAAEVVKEDRSVRAARARENAFQVRADNMRTRAEAASQKTLSHDRLRLRLKIGGILQAVNTRLELHEKQEKARRFREGRRIAGRGPDPSLGDADEYAIGLAGINKDDHMPGEEIIVTPRRVAILDGITLTELDMLRNDAWFFIKSPVADEASRTLASTEGASRSSGAESGTDTSLEPLIDFFTPPREEAVEPIQEYIRKLRAQLTPPNPPDYGNYSPSSSLHGDSGFQLAPSLSASNMWDPLERMPCQGRKPGVRADEVSPTLLKVREVYNRRDEADAKWVEDRRSAMVRRFALNDFKAAEQLRERQLEVIKQKELHKVRMLEAQEAKEMYDAELFASNLIFDNVKHSRIKLANSIAEAKVEQIRGRAEKHLDNWQEGVDRSEKYLRDKEKAMIKASELSWAKKMERLDRIGDDRHYRSETHMHKNTALKVSIQASSKGLLEQRREQKAMRIGEESEEKQQRAAERREKGYGGRYGFVEKAFGPGSTGFDARHHWMTPDRRDGSWQRNVESWKKGDQSASVPSLRATM